MEEPLDGVLAEILPELATKYPRWFMLFLTASAAYGPKIGLYVKRKNSKPDKVAA